jgi:hypothetical protein
LFLYSTLISGTSPWECRHFHAFSTLMLV